MLACLAEPLCPLPPTGCDPGVNNINSGCDHWSNNSKLFFLYHPLYMEKGLFLVVQTMSSVELLAPHTGKQEVVYHWVLGAKTWHAQGEDVVDLELKWRAYH